SLRAARAFVVFGALAAAVTALPRCAKSRCEFTSDCDRGRCTSGDCVLDCQASIDCPSGGKCIDGRCEGGGVDAGGDAQGGDTQTSDTSSTTDTTGVVDTASTTDTSTITDTSTPETPGTKAYLDGCATDGDCASGHCTPTAPRFCTRGCSGDGDCADGQICSSSLCLLDDTGTRGCDTATGVPCPAGCI